MLEIIANNATGPSFFTSDSTVSTPASVRSQLQWTGEPTLDNVQPHPALPPLDTHTHRKDLLRQQRSSPAILAIAATPHQSAQEIQDDQVDSTSTPSWNFRDCILELKDTEALLKWKFIGRHLGVSDSTIESIDKENVKDTEEAFYQMMRRWKKSKGEEATYEKLIDCLKKEKLTAAADRIKKYQV